MTGFEDDAALLVRARAHDDAAFAELVGKYRTRAWSVCLRVTGNWSDAEDALQDALCAAWRNLDRFREDARFGTWLYRIAANAALAVVQRRRDTPTDADEQPELADHHDGYRQTDDREHLFAAIRQLPDPFRVALVLREFGDLTYEEIAAHQGIGVQTVKSRINRARRAVAQLLVER